MNKYYKIKICEDWETFGECKYGSDCRYAHGIEDVRLPVCRYDKICYNKNCKFVHTDKNKLKNDISLYYNLEINKDKNKMLKYYIEELKKHIDICEKNFDKTYDFLGPLLKKELINIKLLNDMLQEKLND